MNEETKAGDPVGEVTHTDVLPDSNGMYRHEFLSDSRIPNQAELYLIPPDTEALRQRNAELLRMLTEQDYEYNRNTNNLIKRHSKQLAAQAERIKVALALIALYRKRSGWPEALGDCDEKSFMEESIAKLGEQ